MKFKHSFVPREEMIDTVVDGKRTYVTPDGDKFKSVTTIIGEKSDKSWLKSWRDRVGEDEADQILVQAQNRGTAIHNLAEKYVMNDSLWFQRAMPVNVVTFKKIAAELDKSLGVVYGVEYPLWSKMLQTAGRTDLPAQWWIDGRHQNAIVDFKTSRKTKDRLDIPGYFVQATAYALMFEELTGIKMPWIVVIVAPDDSDTAQVFVEKSREWYPKVREVFCM